jgi:tetraacyldisaccharide 4'-kinase
MARAHAAILTGASDLEGSGAALAEALRPYGFTGPGFASQTVPGEARTAMGSPIQRGERVVLVTAIARPDSFLATVRSLGYEIAGELRFPDHHRYPPASLARIEEAFRSSGAGVILSTAKDRVKLHGRLAVPLAELPIRAEPEPAFWVWLNGEVDRLLYRTP